MAGIPPFDANQRIPNDPFINPNANRYNLRYPTGELIFGDYFYVDYATGTLFISPPPPFNGTVFRVAAGSGLQTAPVGGITTTGSIGLKTVPTISPGSYTYPTIAVNGFGKLTLAVNGPTPLVSLVGTLPVFVSGSNPSLNLGIRQSTLVATGAAQLNDSLTSPDSTKALTAQQGYNLGLQMIFVGSSLADQVLGGTVDVATGNVTYVTPDGLAATPPFTVAVPLPAAAPAYDNFYFYTVGNGTYTPPGGVATSCVPNDKVICIDGSWEVVQSGVRLVPATTTVYGTTVLSTPPEVQALTEPSKSVTPAGLAVMVASETQVGFVELATDAETQAFTDDTRAVTASSVGTLQATTTTRGLVLLSDSTSDPSVVNAPTSNALKTYVDSSLDELLITAQGDLIAGLSYQTPVIVPKGTSRSILTVDDTKAFQGSMDWNVPESLVSWPVGAIIWYLAPLAPATLWLECDGRLLSADIAGPYYDLYDLIGTTYNLPGDPAGFFRIPDLRGVFVRGWSDAGPNPTPTALDPGRTFASSQGTAYKQHSHTVTDPGHIHQFPLTEHTHTSNGGTVQHAHASVSFPHSHVGRLKVSGFIVGDQGGLFDSNAAWGAPQGPFSLQDSVQGKTGVSVKSALTSVSLNNAVTGLTVNTVTTGLTVDNSPPTPPSPNESRPYNIALLPMIKYRPT
jgi:hypothetical protein